MSKYVIARDYFIEFGMPVDTHYFSKDGMVEDIKEAKVFRFKFTAYRWWKRNWLRLENMITIPNRNRYYLVEVSKKEEFEVL